MQRNPPTLPKLRKPKPGSSVKITKDRPNVYSYDFTLQGARFRGSTHTADLDEAERFVSQERQKIYEQAFYGKKPEIHLEEALIRYWDEYASTLKSCDTVWARLKHFKEFFIKTLGINYLHEIDDAAVWKYVVHRRQQRRPSTKKDSTENTNAFISDATITKELHTLNNMNTMATELWKVSNGDFVITLHKKNLKKSEPLINFIDQDKQVTFIEELVEYLRAPLIFKTVTGLRWGNVRDFRTSQIDWKEQNIRFYIKSKLMGGKLLVLPLTDDIASILEMVGVTPENKEDRLVFTYNDGKPLGDHRKAIDAAYRKSGVRRLKGQCVHLLRHTAATNMLRESKDIRMTQELLGHQSIKTTTVYSHVLQDAKRKALSGAASQFSHIIKKEEK